MTTAPELYLKGWWENESGWVKLEQPLIVDLTRFQPPKLRAHQRVFISRLEVCRTPTGPNLTIPLALHASRFPFDAAKYLDFCQRLESRGVLDVTTYRAARFVGDYPSGVLGTSINFTYGAVVAAQLFVWDRAQLEAHRLGALDFLLQASWYKSIGAKHYCLGESAPYKLQLFGDYLCT